MRTIVLSALLLMISNFLSAQKAFHGYGSVGYGIENRIGFHGGVVQGGGIWHFNPHLSGAAGVEYFHGWSVPGWDKTLNQNGYFRQFTPSIHIEYHTGGIPGTGLIVLGGIALRKGSTHHFESGQYHNGSFSSPVYVTEKVRGSGLVLGIGYGIPLNDERILRVEFKNQAFLMLNDQYNLLLKILF